MPPCICVCCLLVRCCPPHTQHQLCRQQCSNISCVPDAGAELFLFLTLWCCLVVLPTNLSVRGKSPQAVLVWHQLPPTI